MAGWIGIAIAKAITSVRCPHCGKPQARARERDVQSYVCNHCRRRFDVEADAGRTSSKKRR